MPLRVGATFAITILFMGHLKSVDENILLLIQNMNIWLLLTRNIVNIMDADIQIMVGTCRQTGSAVMFVIVSP